METKVNALVLRAADYNENDKILTLLTAENGKITAGIKGVKKAGAKLKFAAQPFCFAEYVLAKRGERYTVTGACECESFYDLRTDINKFYAAGAAVEVASALTYEGDDCREIFYALVKTLSAICSGDESVPLIEFLVLALNRSGYGLTLNGCAKCGRQFSGEETLRFDFTCGAFTCRECGNGSGASAATYFLLRKADWKSGNDGENLVKEAVPDAEKRALKLLKEYYVYKFGGSFKSLSEYINLI